MNVPEGTPVTFLLPHSDTSAYTAIVSVTVALLGFLLTFGT